MLTFHYKPAQHPTNPAPQQPQRPLHPPSITISTIHNPQPPSFLIKRQKAHQSIYSPPSTEGRANQATCTLTKKTPLRKKKKPKTKKGKLYFFHRQDKTNHASPKEGNNIPSNRGGGRPQQAYPHPAKNSSSLNKGNPYRRYRERERERETAV